MDEHNNNVVMLLQSRLASMGMGFKDVLELRTQVSFLVLVRIGLGGGECGGACWRKIGT